jgi:glycine cleavage system H protein
MYPAGYRYSKDHGWIEVAGMTATVGITDYAQQELGDIVFVELPELDAQVQAGQSFGTIESVKAVSELISPISGEVTEINRALSDAPERINRDPHGSGWLVKVRLADQKEIAGLMDFASYQKYAEEKTNEASG